MEASNTVCGTEKNDPDALYIALAKVINEATNEKEATSQLTSGNVRNDTVQFLKTNIPKVDQVSIYYGISDMYILSSYFAFSKYYLVFSK